MSIPTNIQPFWHAFAETVGFDASSRFCEAFHFDDNESSANELAALVLSGRKRATAGLLWAHQHYAKPLPTVGALSVVTDWQGTPLCIIETTDIEVVPFDNVTDSFAAAEGEGDSTLSYWRDVHWRFFSRECQRMGREPDGHMPVVCERFKVIYPTCD